MSTSVTLNVPGWVSAIFKPQIPVVIALIVVVGVVVAWKPWVANVPAGSRTISVTGDAEIKADPDQFVFYPTYSFTETSKTAASAAATAKSNEIVAGLKKAGATDSQIKTSVDGYPNYDYTSGKNSITGYTYSLNVTVTLDSKSHSQAIQDYLVSTDPTGDVTPSAGFSIATEKDLKAKARDVATKDARAKAEQSAKNLGFHVGEVKSVDDGSGYDSIRPSIAQGVVSGANATDSKSSQLLINPGQDSISYSLTVVFYLK